MKRNQLILDDVIGALEQRRSPILHTERKDCALYLGWLLCAQSGELEPVDLSPPAPPGLAKLSASLTSLAEFLRIDRTLIRVAAEPAAKNRTVADLMQNLEASSRKQSRFNRRTLNIWVGSQWITSLRRSARFAR